MDTPKIEFYKLRDFGAKINALVEFLRENFGKLLSDRLFLCTKGSIKITTPTVIRHIRPRRLPPAFIFILICQLAMFGIARQ